MSLFVETQGEGQDIVLLHGWGFNSAIWRCVADELIKNYRVTLIDLPGFGRSAKVKHAYEIDALIETLVKRIPENSILLGWSMGGLIAQGIALKHPRHVAKLILLASNAQFIASDDWPHAMKPEVLSGFIDDLIDNFTRTLQVFLMLQASGGDHARETIRQMKSTLFAYGEPDENALRGGLQLLKNISFVSQLGCFNQPVHLLCGRRDTMMPLAAAKVMADKIPQATLHVFEQAAHAPFISHYDLFMSTLKNIISIK